MAGESKAQQAAEVESWRGVSADTQEDFRAGSIHGQDQIRYWKEHLKASNWVIEVLEQGYTLPFEKYPECSYEEDNNQSAKNDMAFIRDTVKKWEQQGVVQFVQDRPAAVSPLTVATRVMEDGSEKKRLCFDGSRFINPRLQKQKVNLAHLQSALEITEKGDWQAVYDLTNAFFHIRIWPGHRKFLGASFEQENGQKQYFQFQVLPFGVATAVHAITKIFKPMQSHFGQLGIRHSIYIDDGRVVSETKEQAQSDYKTVLQVVRMAGWQVAEAKSDKPEDVAQVKAYLGFEVNAASMTVHLKEHKKRQLSQVASDVAASGGRCLRVKDLASMIGQVAAAEPALGPMVAVMTRRAYAQLEQAVESRGWSTTVRLSQEVVDDFRELKQLVAKFDGTPIRTQKTQISVASIVGPPSEHIKTHFIANHRQYGSMATCVGDASATTVCAFSITGGQRFFFKKELNAEERQQSSGFRELMTVKYALQEMAQKGTVKEETNLYWITDSENLVKFLTKGSGKTNIQKEVLEILAHMRQLKLELRPIHLLREDPRIQEADAGSKSADSDDWSVDDESFRQLEDKYGPFTVDLFANEFNRKVSKFYAQFFAPSAAGVEAFSQDWHGERAWVCPPVKHVIGVIKKIRQEAMSGILIVPDWKSARYQTFVYCRNGELKWPFKKRVEFKPYLKQTSGGKSALKGQPRFAMLALLFDSGSV